MCKYQYPYITALIKNDSDHPLKSWLNSASPILNSACSIINSALKTFENTTGFDELKKSIQSNKNNLWSYIAELYIAIALSPALNKQGRKLSFNFKTTYDKKIDLLIENHVKSAVEVSSMLKCKNLNILIPKLFILAENAKCGIDIQFYNDNMSGLGTYQTISDICNDFSKQVNKGNEFIYLNGGLKIHKKEGISVASNIDSSVVSEYKVVDDITQRIHEESKQLQGFTCKRVLILQMQHYYPIARYYFDAFSENVGGYEENAKKLLENIPDEIDQVIFWWTSINQIEPHSLFLASRKDMKIIKVKSADQLVDFL